MSDVAYAPTLDEVAALVPSRAKGQYGRATTFDETTQPTGDQVQTIIDRSASKVFSKVGDPPDALLEDAKEIVALRAAMLVELTYFGDQIRADRSPYGELKALYEEAVKDYLADRAQLGGDEEPGTADDQAPLFSFPDPDAEAFARASGAEIANDMHQGPCW
jgi:hypothetical protein